MPDSLITNLGQLSAVGQGNPKKSKSSGSHTLAVTVVGTGALAYAGVLMGSNDNIGWTTAATLSASGSDNIVASASVAVDYAFWRHDVTTLTGTGATCTPVMSTDSEASFIGTPLTHNNGQLDPASAQAVLQATFADDFIVASLGDSIDDIFHNAGTFAMNSRLAWAKRFLGAYRISIPGSLNLAVSGATLNGNAGTADVREQAKALPAGACDLASVNIGFNSIGTASSSVLVSLCEELISILKTKAPRLCFTAIRPRGSAAPFTVAGQAQVNFLNNFMFHKSLVDPQIKFYDPTSVLIDFSTGQLQSALTFDGLHHNIPGGFLEGKNFAPWLVNTYNLAPNTDWFTNPLDMFDAVNNPSGNLLQNTLFNTASGGVAMNGATGTIPASHRFARNAANATHTADFALATDPDYSTLKNGVITMGGTGGGGLTFLDQYTAASPNILAGDKVVLEAIVFPNIPAGYRGIYLSLAVDNGVTQLATAYDGNFIAGQTLPAINEPLYFKTDPMTVPAGVVNVQPMVAIGMPSSGSVAGSVAVKRMRLRKVA